MTYEEFKEKVSSVILTDDGNCPVTPVVQMLQGKWKLQILYELCNFLFSRCLIYKVHVPQAEQSLLYQAQFRLSSTFFKSFSDFSFRSFQIFKLSTHSLHRRQTA